MKSLGECDETLRSSAFVATHVYHCDLHEQHSDSKRELNTRTAETVNSTVLHFQSIIFLLTHGESS